MWKTLLAVIVLVLAGIAIYAATKPDNFRVQRTATINAPPEKVFALLTDLKGWQAWSPWEKKDPAMKRTFGATTSGKGASYAWEGNKDVGQGRMQIADSVSPSKVTLNLDFVKPFEAHNLVVFTLEPKGDATSVTWAMQGDTPYLAKIIHVFVNMDKMVGKDFEAGLANLKAAAEQ